MIASYLQPVRERIDDATDHALPVAPSLLAEQARTWIPGRILPPGHPPPLRRVREQHPDRLPHRPREVRDCGIHTNHQIEIRDQGTRLRKIRKVLREICNPRISSDPLGRGAALKAEKL